MDAEPSTSGTTDKIPQKDTETSPKLKMITKDQLPKGVLNIQKLGPKFRIIPYTRQEKKVAPKTLSQPSLPKKYGDEMYTEDNGPHFYSFKNAMETLPIVTKNLPQMFKDFPIRGAPQSVKKLKEFQRKTLQDFVGSELNESEFDALEKLCNPKNLCTGSEIKMTQKVPAIGLLQSSSFETDPNDEASSSDEVNLQVVEHFVKRQMRDENHLFPKTLKYRGLRLIHLDEQVNEAADKDLPPDLEPGKDLIFRVRVYRPSLHYTAIGDKNIRGRHSVFDTDIILCGRQTLEDFRDKISCRNDLDMRMDVSEHPDMEPIATAKTAFPSGFLFINNTFYVDGRRGCHDTSLPVRQWVQARGFGDYPAKEMACRLEDIVVKLGHPDVYVHQGNCEHLFMFSEIRLLNRSDPLHLSTYPFNSAVSQNQMIYCTTCSEFGAKWVITGTDRVPFDPAFFCDTCFKQYMYIDGKKIGNFKAYHYKGNEVNLLKNRGPLDK